MEELSCLVVCLSLLVVTSKCRFFLGSTFWGLFSVFSQGVFLFRIWSRSIYICLAISHTFIVVLHVAFFFGVFYSLYVVVKQVKNLLFEHQNNVTQLKTESETSLKLQNDDHRGRESELRKDKRALKLELKEMELSHEDVIKSLKQEHDKNITKLRQEFERNAKELQVKYDKKTAALRNELELRRKIEIHEIEERKNTHINELMKKHEKAFSEIKNYYNDITHNNLDLIKSLKEDVAEMKRKEAQNEKLMFEIAQENKRLSEPLQRSMKEVEELRKQLANYHKDKMSLAHAKARVKAQDDSLKKTEWEHEVLQQRFATVEKERDELYDKFVNSIYDVQQKAGFKNLLLEKKLDTLGEELEKKDAQLAEVLRASNLDPASLGSITASLDAVMDEKNKTIQELQYELERVSKAHNDVIRTYEAKMHQFGIPKEELGFRPLISKTSAAPAGLVAK